MSGNDHPVDQDENVSSLLGAGALEMIRLFTRGGTPAWKRLVSPIRYLWIRHELKGRFDWGWPFLLTAITMLMFWCLPVTPSILGEAGFLKGVRELIAHFAAFYVVALAAVATFSRESLDLPIEGTTPTLNGKSLSRRQFVCYLFGYLAVLSFALFLAAVFAQIIAPSARMELSAIALWWVKAVCGTIFAFGFWNMIITTMLGIYFLVERVHIEQPADGESGAGSSRLIRNKAA
jgi:hypothetical protein